MATAIIQRYDPTITQAPFEFITLGQIEFDDVPIVTFREHYDIFWQKMDELGYRFRFYSGGKYGDDTVPYFIVVD